jgi:predicted SAM-dependent methyltransferase
MSESRPQKALLNVGAGKREFAVPAHYSGWRQDFLDVDPAVKPDIVMDAREMTRLAAGTYEAIFCSHNLEHYHRHDCVKVIDGFRHVLTPDGFVEVHVPDIGALMKHVVANNLDIDDVVHASPEGAVLVRDMIYGYHVEIERSGHDFYLHKTGFTASSLWKTFMSVGFTHGGVICGNLALLGYFFKQTPSEEVQKLLGLRVRSH